MMCDILWLIKNTYSALQHQFLFYPMKQYEWTEDNLCLSEKVDGPTNFSAMWTATI